MVNVDTLTCIFCKREMVCLELRMYSHGSPVGGLLACRGYREGGRERASEGASSVMYEIVTVGGHLVSHLPRYSVEWQRVLLVEYVYVC